MAQLGYHKRAEVDVVAAGEQSAVWLPLRGYQPGQKYGVLWSHEHSGRGHSCLTQQHLGLQFHRLAQYKIPILSADWSGPNHWASVLARNRMSLGKALLETTYGAKAGKVGYNASSMGTLLAFRHIMTFPGWCAGASMALPICDLSDFYYNRATAEWKAEMYAAHGGITAEAFEALIPTIDPMQNTEAFVDLPILLVASDNDALLGTDAVEQFASETGLPLIWFSGAIGAGGHTYPLGEEAYPILDHLAERM